jgi:hypothetical protein
MKIVRLLANFQGLVSVFGIAIDERTYHCILSMICKYMPHSVHCPMYIQNRFNAVCCKDVLCGMFMLCHITVMGITLKKYSWM